MGWSYWKVVIRYGHVGKGREVSVARFLMTPDSYTAIDVMGLAEQMPGTKSRATLSVHQVELEEYLQGKRLEKENFFLQRLFENKQAL